MRIDFATEYRCATMTWAVTTADEVMGLP